MNVNANSVDLPNISFEIYDPVSGNLLNSSNTGNITTTGVWQKSSLVFTATQSTIELVLRNNTLGTLGNDLAIDDITFGLAGPPKPIAATGSATCTGLGSLTISSPTGSTIEYSVDGTTYQAGTVFSNLTPGVYSVTARYTGTFACTSEPTSVTIGSAICGNVFNDANGLTDNTVNGPGVNGTSLSGTPLYASLVSGGVVIATVPITSTGTYSFTNVGNGNYSVVLTTTAAGSTTPSLPTNWVSTGENIGTAAGNDGTVNGILPVTVSGASVTDANFGIEQRPVVTAGTNPTQVNPGGTVAAPVSSTLFTGTDPEDGSYPTNLTGRTVTLTPATNGTLYYNGTPVSTTTVIPNFDPTKVTLDPTATGATTGTGGMDPDPTFTYTVIDNAGVESLPKTIIVPFTAPLPVSLVSFTAQTQQEHSVLVQWKTSWERNNQRYVVERSKNLVTFEVAGEVSDVAGSSNSVNSYQFVDQTPYRGTSYYRLRQVDQDGSMHTYPAVTVVVDARYGVYPNPVTGSAFTLELDEPNSAVLHLFSANGREVPLSQSALGQNSLKVVPGSTLPTGVYMLTVEERGTHRTHRLVVQ